MSYKNKNKEIFDLINCFFDDKKTIQDLQDYAWNIIDDFSREGTTNDLTDVHAKVFWFAIWQIQHLASEEHVQDGTLERELRKILKYLLDPTSMPSGSYGLPPQ